MVKIRQLELADVLRYANELTEMLYTVLSENIPQGVTVEHAQQYFRDMQRFVQDGTAVLLGALDGEQLIAFHWGYEVKVLGEQRMHSYLICVLRPYRGQAIGTQLSRALECTAQSRGIGVVEAMVTWANERAVNYHLKNGFVIERVKVCKRLNQTVC